MNTAILRYPLPVLGKTDKRVLVLTLLKAPEKEGMRSSEEKKLLAMATGKGAVRTNPPAVKICLPTFKKKKKICLPAGSVWGHVCEALLATTAVFGWPAGAWPESAWVVPDQARERGRLLRINAVGDAEFLEPGGRRSRAQRGQASRKKEPSVAQANQLAEMIHLSYRTDGWLTGMIEEARRIMDGRAIEGGRGRRKEGGRGRHGP